MGVLQQLLSVILSPDFIMFALLLTAFAVWTAMTASVHCAIVPGSLNAEKFSVGTNNLSDGCVLQTCPALNRTIYCQFLNPNQIGLNFMTPLINAFENCFKNASGSCGIPLSPLIINGLTFSVNNLPNDASGTCSMTSGNELRVTGINDVNFEVTANRTVLLQPTFDLKTTFMLQLSPSTYTCSFSNADLSLRKKRISGLLSTWNSLSRLCNPPALIPTTTTPPPPPTPMPPSRGELTIGGFNYSTESTIQLVFNYNTSGLASINMITIPRTTITPFSISGSFNQQIQQALNQFLSAYLTTVDISNVIFNDVIAFINNLFQGLIQICPVRG